MIEETSNTKERIIEVAGKLFAKNGYDGTSVRSISKMASVNLSSVNYHFQNKETLYHNVFEKNFKWIEEEIISLGNDESLNLFEFSFRVYSFFGLNSEALINSFRIFLSDGPLIGAPLLGDTPDKMAPPGKEAFVKKIIGELGEGFSDNCIYSAMRLIFGEIIHMCLCHNSKIMKENKENAKFLEEEEIKKNIFNFIEAIIFHIKSNPSKWD